jgi:predicted nucleotidyltransferase component of viral defense system
MIEPADFNFLVEQAMRIPGRNHMRPVVEKELLHYDLLFCLDKEGLLDQLTFQGGTSLRLCYGSVRFSEDLDFVGGTAFSSQQLMPMKTCIEDYIGKRYQLEVTVKEPKELRTDPEHLGLKIDKWQIAIVTAPDRKDFPKQRIKIEIANIPAYSRQARSVQVNYNFLPDGYGDTLVMTETLDEIMADKLVSLVNTERYIRHRDIWDLRWLKQEGAKVNLAWIHHKIKDYKVDHYFEKLDKTANNLQKIIHGKAFKDEMNRFIPTEVQERTLNKEKFYDFLTNEIRGLLDEVKQEKKSNDAFNLS